MDWNRIINVAINVLNADTFEFYPDSCATMKNRNKRQLQQKQQQTHTRKYDACTYLERRQKRTVRENRPNNTFAS